ncbi:hypothetical protein JANAI62_30380 [Jannaschia pagri]|uniref:Tissue inhibitor of metalloproteinase n=2 Tax=Roseobacteraceae TaxID=2854170 RepID=A0ABQ4NPV2_9RHOB|nr:hypothetical protein JANAI61_31830 [Jannaschia sp. AI_61]GIT96415.1 hypothetical protein JANAI62_30380 [Jannaschia sp. AI_62]
MGAAMIRVIAVLIACWIAGQAQALSCMRPTVQGTYLDADGRAETYVLALGRLTPVPGQTRPAEPANPNDRVPYSLMTRFDGALATSDGFTRTARFDVRVDVGCAGPWCGGVPTSKHLFFLKRDGATHSFESGPCPWFAFEPTVENRADALACLNGGMCRRP